MDGIVTERITIQLPMHPRVFARLMQAIAVEFPGSRFAEPMELDQLDTGGSVVVEVDTAEPDHGGLLDRLAREADRLEAHQPRSDLAADLRLAHMRIRLAERAAADALGARTRIRPQEDT